MHLGASTKSFGGMSVAETADIFAKSGLNCAELCFCHTDLSGWKYNLTSYRPLPDGDDILRATESFSRQGISVVSLGVYNCLWQGGASGFSESLRCFCEYRDAAKQTGVNMLCTHSGVAEARIFGGRVPEDYKRLVFETFACAFSEAHKRGITVALECANWDAVKNYAEFLELKRYIKSTLGTDEMLKYIGVPCYDSAYENSDDIAMFHMKDKEKDAKFYTCFGKGDADFSEFFKGAKAYGDIPYILEYVTASNAYEISCLLRKYAKEQ